MHLANRRCVELAYEVDNFRPPGNNVQSRFASWFELWTWLQRTRYSDGRDPHVFSIADRQIADPDDLAWIRNHYQRETIIRPNPRMLREAMFKFTDIQTMRSLSEEEVLQVNLITKAQANRYVAAAEKDWLYPEKFLRRQKWPKIGHGLLFMPDPRDIHMGGEIVIGFKDGSATSFGEYGHRPWEKGFKDERRFEIEWAALQRFKAEFAVRFGPAHRGSSYQFMRGGPHVDSPDFFQHYVDKLEAKKPKRRPRRRKRNPFGRVPRTAQV